MDENENKKTVSDQDPLKESLHLHEFLVDNMFKYALNPGMIDRICNGFYERLLEIQEEKKAGKQVPVSDTLDMGKRLTDRKVDYMKWFMTCNRSSKMTIEETRNTALALEKLQKYENLAEDERLVLLKAKVGDTVFWCPSSTVLCMKISYFMIMDDKIRICIEYNDGDEAMKNFSTMIDESAIGRALFFDKVTAENAIKNKGE